MSNYRSHARITISLDVVIIGFLVTLSGCKSVIVRQDVRPRVLRDVPARVLAFRLEADVAAPNQQTEDPGEKLEIVQNDFTSRRRDEALIRTVTSPDGNRVLALYATEADPPSTFRIDLYSSDGQFLKNLIPPDLSCLFPETVDWSPDSNLITFIARKRAAASPTPTPAEPVEPLLTPQVSPSVGPVFAPVPSFNTEQIYVCNRDGFDLKPLTTRDGLIYFAFAWAPDSHALAALACKEEEWEARERQFRLPTGRPRLITLDGQERLLDDELAEALPVWSPDSSKVATAFETNVAIYDAATNTPTQAQLPLRDALIAASKAYEKKSEQKKMEDQRRDDNSSASPTASPSPEETTLPEIPASFNPIVRLEWSTPERLYFKTAFVRIMPNEAINTFQRWHLVHLSAQAAVLK